MISISSEALQSWVVLLLWPLTRVMALIVIAPVLSQRAMPRRVQVSLGLLITLTIIPTLPPMPPIDIFSYKGVFILAQQMVIGLTIGFSTRIVFGAVEMAGQLIGMTMGLGFATFYDPQTQGQSNALSQFLVLMATLIFLSLDGHLIMISALVDSFRVIPITADWPGGLDFMRMARWGTHLFSSGLLLALPAVAALLITNMALGILTRSAPQLNLFGIGFPVTITIGFVVIALVLPGLLQPLIRMLQDAFTQMQQISVPPALPLR